MVLAESPVSEKEFAVGEETWVKAEQEEPWQRSTRYPVAPTLSVEAVHVRLIWLEDTAAAAKLAGVDGAAVSAVCPGRSWPVSRYTFPLYWVAFVPQSASGPKPPTFGVKMVLKRLLRTRKLLLPAPQYTV